MAHKKLLLSFLLMASPVMAHAGKADATPPPASSTVPVSSGQPAARQGAWAKAHAILSTERWQWMALTTLSWLLVLGRWVEVSISLPNTNNRIEVVKVGSPLLVKFFSQWEPISAVICGGVLGLLLLGRICYQKIAGWLQASPEEADTQKKAGWGQWLIVQVVSLFGTVGSVILAAGVVFIIFGAKQDKKLVQAAGKTLMFFAGVAEGWLLMRLVRGLCFLLMESLALATEPAARQATWAKARARLSTERGQWATLTLLSWLLSLRGTIGVSPERGTIEVSPATSRKNDSPPLVTFTRSLIAGSFYHWTQNWTQKKYVLLFFAIFGMLLLAWIFYEKTAGWLQPLPDQVDLQQQVGRVKWLMVQAVSLVVAGCLAFLMHQGSKEFDRYVLAYLHPSLEQGGGSFCIAVTEGWLLTQLGRGLYYTYRKIGHTMDGTGQADR